MKAHGSSATEAAIATSRHKGKRAFILRMALYPAKRGFPFNLNRRQLPVKLAFATTIIISQGQALGRVVGYLRQQVFGHGQLCVATSRARGPKRLRFALPVSDNLDVRNVVYREALT